jgi:hypothetical protein
MIVVNKIGDFVNLNSEIVTVAVELGHVTVVFASICNGRAFDTDNAFRPALGIMVEGTTANTSGSSFRPACCWVWRSLLCGHTIVLLVCAGHRHALRWYKEAGVQALN